MLDLLLTAEQERAMALHFADMYPAEVIALFRSRSWV
jgi:hypothetical protein